MMITGLEELNLRFGCFLQAQKTVFDSEQTRWKAARKGNAGKRGN
jgi:hypothetical protein